MKSFITLQIKSVKKKLKTDKKADISIKIDCAKMQR